MPNFRRKKLSGGYYFFTVVTYKRQRFLTDETARRCLRNVWQHVCEKRPFKTIAICLMPEHIHCIWKLPDGDFDYSTRWSLIKRGFTQQWLKAGGFEANQTLSRIKKGRRGVWHRRFWEHCLRDEEDLSEHIRYIHYNPVKHKLVEKPSDWKWSTFHRFEYAGGLDAIGNMQVGDMLSGE